jgi:drug/metabolite transporter (DMT)-like permease
MMTGATPTGFGVGEVLGTACAIVFSFQILAVNVMLPRDDVWRMTAGMFLLAGAITLLACAFVPRSTALASIAREPRVAVNFMLLLLFPTIFSYSVMNVYQPRIEATHAALIYLIEPIFASIYAWIVRGAGLTTVAIVGAALILLANAVIELLYKRR